MSFLNALASDGLSVGLRFYAAKMSRASEMAANAAASPEEEQKGGAPAEAERPAPLFSPPKEQSPEEMAAGRAEAKALLASSGALGFLQAANTEKQPDQDKEAANAAEAGAAEDPYASEDSKDPEGEGPVAGKDLTEDEQRRLQEMKQRDREVHTHEQAHISAGGGLAGAASYEYEKGPDGNKYAVAGEVPISASGGGGPEQQLQDAETVKRAALAPAEPSSQDRAVAAQASADINRLRGEAAKARRGGGEESGQAAADSDAAQADEAGGMADISAPKRLATNGESFGSRVMSAYAAAKSGFMAAGSRPALASV